MKFLIYDETTQRTCLSFMGRKMLAALMMEGKFSGKGIHSLDADDNMLAAMARELVEKGGVGESTDAVCNELRRERAAQAALTTQLPKPEVIEEPPVMGNMFSEPAAVQIITRRADARRNEAQTQEESGVHLADRLYRWGANETLWINQSVRGMGANTRPGGRGQSRPITGYKSADIEQVIADIVLTDALTS